MKKIKKIYVIFFMILLLLPLILFNWKDDYISLIDNRPLKKFPNKENFGENDKTNYIQSYINDRIGGREKIISIYTILNDKIFNLLEHPTYTYGKEGYIFFKMEPNIKYNEYHKKFAKTIKKIQILFLLFLLKNQNYLYS